MEKVTGLKKVHEVLDIESKSLATMEEQLEEMKRGKIRSFFQDSLTKEQYSLRRKKLEGQIQSKSAFIENETERLENASFCDTDILTSFITRTLSIIEEQAFDQWDFRFDTEECDLIRLVAPKYACEEIARLYCAGKIYDIDDIDDVEITDDDDNEIDLILFELYDDYDVTNIYDVEQQDVPEEYDDGNLRNMLLRLVEEKYKNPDLSDEEIVEEVIRQIAEEHSSQEEIEKINVHKKA